MVGVTLGESPADAFGLLVTMDSIDVVLHVMLLVCELKWNVGIVFVFSLEGALVVVAEAYASVEDHVDIK